MKKKLYIMTAFAILAAFVSCQRENSVENALVFTANIDNIAIRDNIATRTTIDGWKIKWVETDKININGISYTVHPNGINSRRASLTKDSGNEPASPYKAVYPSSLYVASPSPHYVLPAELTYSDGEFNIPMYESTLKSRTIKS